MKKRIGVICPSDIAQRRFLPALSGIDDFTFAGVAVADKCEWEGATDEIIEKEYEKATAIVNTFSGKIFNGYNAIIQSDIIDALYLPLPPALHYKWALSALENGKHVLVEKPFTTSLIETKILISLAQQNKLAVHENYMFGFHSQIDAIKKIIEGGDIGEVRLYRICFGFPLRALNDFRYNKELGGGALLDAGGYTVKLATLLLGNKVRVTASNLNYLPGFNVDMYGSATLVNEEGTTVQVAFGMDNSYKCDLEVWGSKASLFTGRILTAPPGYEPELVVKHNNESKTIKLPSDDAFRKSIIHFNECVEKPELREKNYADILLQAKLIDEFININSNNNGK